MEGVQAVNITDQITQNLPDGTVENISTHTQNLPTTTVESTYNNEETNNQITNEIYTEKEDNITSLSKKQNSDENNIAMLFSSEFLSFLIYQ